VQATNYAAVNAAPIAVGRIIGAATVGLYSRSYQLISLPMVQLAAPLTRVVVPILAHVKRTQDIVAAARRIQLVLTYALVPLIAFLLVGGDPLVVLLFGEPWRGGGTLSQILALGAIFQAMGYIHYWLYVRMGKLVALWIYELAVWTCVSPLYFVFGDRGASAIAALYSIGLFLNWLTVGIFGLRQIGLPRSQFMVPSLRRLAWLTPVIACGVVARETASAAGMSDVLTLLTSTSISLVIAAALLIDPKFRAEIRVFIAVIGGVRSGRIGNPSGTDRANVMGPSEGR
jgi:PST family polysaccharide transporter